MTREAHPVNTPRPLFETLPKAIEAAIRQGNAFTDIRPAKWAETYRCGVEDVKHEWERVQSRLSQEPNNKFEENE